jgi:hypothetical protein
VEASGLQVGDYGGSSIIGGCLNNSRIFERYSALPIVYHVSLRTRFGEEEYIQLLVHGFRLGADYVVVNLELEESHLRHSSTQKAQPS